jgi:hypothetical protein
VKFVLLETSGTEILEVWISEEFETSLAKRGLLNVSLRDSVVVVVFLAVAHIY